MENVPTQAPRVFIVVPCYNEEQVLPETLPLLLEELSSLCAEELASPESKILMVNDGSTDGTWELIKAFAAQRPEVEGVSLSHNRGHQNALLCGLMEARSLGCDCAISIDADGQDDVYVMDDMVKAFLGGADVVFGVRNDRSSDTPFKRVTARTFYKLMEWLDVETVFDHADYRLLSSRALDALSELPEGDLYLRGMVPALGFPSTTVEYSRKRRLEGKSHYSLSRMVNLALDGITSFSLKPIHMVTSTGAITAIAGAATLVTKACRRKRTTEALLVTLSGIQLVATGIVGEYAGRANREAKRRPRWTVAARTWADD